MLSSLKERMTANQKEATSVRSTTPATPGKSSVALADLRNRIKFDDACKLPIGKIVPDPEQPRRSFPQESIDELAASLVSLGQLVPLIVRHDAMHDRYIIIDGERRFRAATQAAKTELTCVVDSVGSQDTILEIQLVVNALREEVNPMEQARAWGRLAEYRKLSLRELAALLNYDHTVVGRKISLLKLPDEIQSDIESGAISQEAGIVLAAEPDPKIRAELHQLAKDGANRTELREEASRKQGAARKTVPSTKGRGGKPRPVTSWRFKGQGGIIVVVDRAKGIDPQALVIALDAAAEKARAELAAAVGN